MLVIKREICRGNKVHSQQNPGWMASNKPSRKLVILCSKMRCMGVEHIDVGSQTNYCDFSKDGSTLP